ncbi:MAG: methyltransferase domain-containing protein [Acidobacteriia bacterium]|nr:methyltransferase domain-containing protein [Terriglobia bacterium]
MKLTERLGTLLELGPTSRVLDVASGNGESAIFLAQRFGCEVVGIDFGAEAVVEASRRATAAGVAHLATFAQGDAEQIDYPDAAFHAVICECAFCTFPDKSSAAAEFMRVLRPSGRAGLSDLTRSGPLPSELEGLLAWVSCIADARPEDEYVGYLYAAGLSDARTEKHNQALAEMVRDIQGKLLGAELIVKLQGLNLPGADLVQAKALARAAADAVRAGLLGYSLVTARRA